MNWGQILIVLPSAAWGLFWHAAKGVGTNRTAIRPETTSVWAVRCKFLSYELARMASVISCGLLLQLWCFVAQAGTGQVLPVASSPVLLIEDATYTANPFGNYLSEILTGEGLRFFQTVQLSDLANATNSAEFISQFGLVLLEEAALTTQEAQLLREYVYNGGNLIVMRPDHALADVLGLKYQAVRPEQSIQFFAIAAQTELAEGIGSNSLQYHGTADNYFASNSQVLAYFQNSIDSPSTNPAVVLNHYGSGKAAAFTFDLARSVVLTRQGNPAWKNTEGDGVEGYRPADMFFRLDGKSWIAPERLAIPQADQTQRLLVNLVLNLSPQPLPRLWYFPRLYKTMVINTGDGEDLGGADLVPPMEDSASYGGHFTTYLREIGITLTDPVQARQWLAAGHELGPHVYAGGEDTCDALQPAYQQIVDHLQQKFSRSARTARSHTIDWCGWTDMAAIEASFGTELDGNYYHYIPPAIRSGASANGYFTGSGLPQRLCAEDGTILPIYQLLTEWPDEWFANSGYSVDQAVQVVRSMISASEKGFYSAFMNNVHAVRYNDIGADITHAWANQMWAICQSNGIPMITAEKLLDFVSARNLAKFQNLTWANGKLEADFSAPLGGQDLTIMLPAWINSTQLLTLSFNGAPVAPSVEVINGRDYAMFTTQVSTGHVIAEFGPDVVAPSFDTLQVKSVGDTNAEIAWQTTERTTGVLRYGLSADGLDAREITNTFGLTHELALNELQPNTKYFLTIAAIDRAGNSVTSSLLTFTTSQTWRTTTREDFLEGFWTGLVVSEDTGGELRLQPALNDLFLGSAMDSQWLGRLWSGGIYTPNISNSQMAFKNPGSGAYVRSVPSFRPGTTIEARLKFSRGTNAASPFLYFGLAGTNLLPWILIGTGYSGNEVDATIYNSRPSDPVFFTAGNIFDEWHDFRIVWEPGQVGFWLDGVLRYTEAVSVTNSLHVFFSAAAATPSDAAITADWVRVVTNRNTLFPVLADRFDAPNGAAVNWLSLTNPIPSTGSWAISGGSLLHSANGTSYHPAILSSAYPALSSFDFQTRAMSTDSNGLFGFVWGLQDARRFYMAQFVPGQGLRVFRTDDWFYDFSQIAEASEAPVPVPGKWFTLRLQARGGRFEIYVDGVLQVAFSDYNYVSGRVGLLGYGGIATRYDDAVLQRVDVVSAPCVSGTYITKVFDAGWKAEWTGIEWPWSLPTGATANIEARFGDSPVPDGSWTPWMAQSGPARRFLQLRVSLCAENPMFSPVLESFSVSAISTKEVPDMALAMQTDSIVLTWPGWAGLRLYSTTNLSSPTFWSPYGNSAVSSNGSYRYVVPRDKGQEFFMLGP